ncbi:LysR family transcriptional regulator [Arhodomonas sp. AD133]|uniref:LysR family transcriptional regulator n=1 Tax=Arhodomonas sp. AD133 TaxID=3415009 RepID=UPI003EB9DA00
MLDDVKHLLAFATVVDNGSFGRAAEELGLSPASVSLYVARLEKRLGVALLYRNTRRFSLTEDGERTYASAKEMLALYANTVGDGGEEHSARLKISVPATFADSPYMDAISAFSHQHPDISLTVLCSDRRADLVADSVDVAIRVGSLPDSSLKAKRITALARTVIASPNLLQRYASISHPGELQAMPWIGLLMRPDRRTFTHTDGEQVTIRYRPRINVDNVNAAYALTKNGVGLSAPPTYLAREGIARGLVTEVLPEWSLEPLEVFAVWPANLPRSSVAHRLIEHLCREMTPDAQ